MYPPEGSWGCMKKIRCKTTFIALVKNTTLYNSNLAVYYSFVLKLKL